MYYGSRIVHTNYSLLTGSGFEFVQVEKEKLQVDIYFRRGKIATKTKRLPLFFFQVHFCTRAISMTYFAKGFLRKCFQRRHFLVLSHQSSPSSARKCSTGSTFTTSISCLPATRIWWCRCHCRYPNRICFGQLSRCNCRWLISLCFR
jgi:hypothetical protein